MGRKRLAAAARTLRPLQQGNLDSLCGLYAVINAVQLSLYTHHRLTRAELLQLFDAGLNVLRRSRGLQSVILTGMPSPLWHKVSAAVLTRASAITGYRFELVAVPLTDEDTTFMLLRQLRWNLERQRPVLICIAGRLDHWTVVRRVSRTRLTLFDSSQHAWLSVRLITLNAPLVADRYNIGRHGVLALRRHDPPP